MSGKKNKTQSQIAIEKAYMLISKTYEDKIDYISELNRHIQNLKILESKEGDFNEKVKLDLAATELKVRMLKESIEVKQNKPYVSLRELMSGEIPKPIFFQTGIEPLDNLIVGIPKGAFVNVAAASGVGKTTLVTKLGLTFSTYKKIVHFDFEMGRYKMQLMFKKYINNMDEQKKEKVLDNYLIDHQSYNLDALEREINYHAYNGCDLFIIDSKMKIVDKTAKDEIRAASNISKKLSELSRDLGVTIILINQMSEASQKEKLPSLKGSGDQLYDSDVVLFLFKEKKENQSDDAAIIEFREDRRILYVRKNRFGKEEIQSYLYYKDVSPMNQNESKEIQVEEQDIGGVKVIQYEAAPNNVVEYEPEVNMDIGMDDGDINEEDYPF